jgi:hypothetical protein
VRISLVCYKSENYYLYAFAADKFLKKSFEHALVELARNIRVMKKFSETNKHYTELEDISDKRLVFFASKEAGYILRGLDVRPVLDLSHTRTQFFPTLVMLTPSIYYNKCYLGKLFPSLLLLILLTRTNIFYI